MSTTLSEQLNYVFQNTALLEAALTHPSFRYENETADYDNQRLEFLGDAALSLASASYLFLRFPAEKEGVLTKLRSRLTSRPALAQVARDLQLGEALRIGKGEALTGGRERDSNLADALEALLGAVYLDGGLDPVEELFQRLFEPMLSSILLNPDEANPKGSLQEFCQMHGWSNPVYRLLKQKGAAHEPQYTVEVRVEDRVRCCGIAGTKREAEAEAARAAFNHLSSS